MFPLRTVSAEWAYVLHMSTSGSYKVGHVAHPMSCDGTPVRPETLVIFGQLGVCSVLLFCDCVTLVLYLSVWGDA